MADDRFELWEEHAKLSVPGADWGSQREQIRRRVLDALGPFPKDVPPVTAETLSVEEDVGHGGYRREKVRFLSEEDDWVYAYLLVPTNVPLPAPAVICPHPSTGGSGKDRTVGLSGYTPGTPPEPGRSYGLELTEWGFVTLSPDMVVDGERVTSGGRAYDTTLFYQRHPNWSLVGKFIWDTQRAIDYLSTREEVKAESIAVAGHSLGAHFAMFSAAFDERIRASVCNGGNPSWRGDPRAPMHWAMPVYPDGRHWVYIPKARPFVEDPSLPAPFGFVEVAALSAPRPMLVGHTEDEARTHHIADFMIALRQTYQALGADDALELMVYAGPHGFPPEARFRAYRWLRHWLR